MLKCIIAICIGTTCILANTTETMSKEESPDTLYTVGIIYRY